MLKKKSNSLKLFFINTHRNLYKLNSNIFKLCNQFFLEGGAYVDEVELYQGGKERLCLSKMASLVHSEV